MIRKNVWLNDYFKGRAFYDANIPGHESAQCGLIFDDDNSIVSLKSYNTVVCDYNIAENSITCNGTYSTTTRKHIGWFSAYINDNYGCNFTYKDFKEAPGE